VVALFRQAVREARAAASKVAIAVVFMGGYLN
jgi:hypothetical protein